MARLPMIGHCPELMAVVRPLLKARQAIEQQTDDLDRKVLKLARYDAQVRSFMTVPGVGPITALCFKATVRCTPSPIMVGQASVTERLIALWGRASCRSRNS